MTTETMKLAREWLREYMADTADGKILTEAELHATFMEAVARECAEIAMHFAHKQLSPEEWPPHGLANYGERFDAGVIRKCGENIAAQIRIGGAMSDAYRERLILRAVMLLLEGVFLGTSRPGFKYAKEEARELVSKIATELAGQTKAEVSP